MSWAVPRRGWRGLFFLRLMNGEEVGKQTCVWLSDVLLKKQAPKQIGRELPDIGLTSVQIISWALGL